MLQLFRGKYLGHRVVSLLCVEANDLGFTRPDAIGGRGIADLSLGAATTPIFLAPTEATRPGAVSRSCLR